MNAATLIWRIVRFRQADPPSQRALHLWRPPPAQRARSGGEGIFQSSRDQYRQLRRDELALVARRDTDHRGGGLQYLFYRLSTDQRALHPRRRGAPPEEPAGADSRPAGSASPAGVAG